MFLLSSVAPMQLVFFVQEKKVPLRRFSACRLYWRVSFHYVWGPKKCWELQSTPLRLARKSPGTNRDDFCLVITLVAKRKMKVSDICWGTSVWNFNLGFVWFHIYMHFGFWIPTTYFKVLSYHEGFWKTESSFQVLVLLFRKGAQGS